MVKVKKLFFFVVSLIPATAFAGFQVVEESVKPAAIAGQPAAAAAAQPQPSKTAAGLQLVALSYIGEPDTDIPVISGFGRDLKLLEAIKQIAPAGWQVFLRDDFVYKPGQGVSWRGGRRWVEVLDILANEQRLSVIVDWGKKTLYVGERVAQSRPVAKSDGEKAQMWTLKEGHTVGREIQEWAKGAGWKVIWNLGKDWAIPTKTTFSGDFKSAASEVIKTLAANGVLIRAQFYDGNRTMVVTGPGVAEQ